MVILTEQIEIPASYEKMEAWAANFEERLSYLQQSKWQMHMEDITWMRNKQIKSK